VQVVRLPLDISRVSESVAVVAPLPSTHSPSSTLLTTARLEQLPLSQHTNLPDAIVTAAPGMIRGHHDFVHIRGHEVALNPAINGVQFWENAFGVFAGPRRGLHRFGQRHDRRVLRRDEHATGPGLCATRCEPHFTQNLALGWTAAPGGRFDHKTVTQRSSSLNAVVMVARYRATMATIDRSQAPPATMEQILWRIQCEFREMPGLRLTCRQAQRLWNLDQLVCESILAALVDVRFLIECDGVFLQRTDPG
jgi:hypothetical protein